MEKQIKCSSNKHKENNAISYCSDCKLNLCNKCEKLHSDLFENHSLYKIDINIVDIFTGFCKEENHDEKLSFFCKNHNQLCCSSCITKIKNKIYGKHTDCEICCIEDIAEDKKTKLKENIIILDDLSHSLNESIDKLKQIYEKISENKEELKLKIQNIFTKIRNIINEREDKLLSDVDKIFAESYMKEEIIKESEKLPNKIKESLEKGRNIDKILENENIKLNSFINDCLKIEENINEINNVNKNIKIYNSIKLNVKFSPEDDESINIFKQNILNFGKIYVNSNYFKFKECPINISEEKIYSISGEFGNIATKTGKDGSVGIICENILDNPEENKWKIKILKTKYNNIKVGVAPKDFDVFSSTYRTCGWYISCNYLELFSGPPHNYCPTPQLFGRPLKQPYSIKNFEIIIILNKSKRTMKFIVNDKDKGELYKEIPIGKDLSPVVFLYDKDDSIEIIKC